MSTLAIIQARMESSRLPGKVLVDLPGKVLMRLGDQPMLEHVLTRVRRMRGVQAMVVATTDHSGDDVIESACRILGVPTFRGSSDDVLDRYYRTASMYEPEVDTIIRFTADCPILDVESSEAIIRAYRSGGYSYISNTPHPATDGWDTEVFSRSALTRAWKEATKPYDREHVTPYIRDSGHFDCYELIPRTIPGGEKWSVDTAEDLERLRRVMREGRELLTLAPTLIA